MPRQQTPETQCGKPGPGATLKFWARSEPGRPSCSQLKKRTATIVRFFVIPFRRHGASLRRARRRARPASGFPTLVFNRLR